jgi:hypothetical protein
MTYGREYDNAREKALKRDDNECQFCGLTQEEHRENYENGLETHHIIPKSAGGGDWVENLITVCIPCHRTLESTQGKAMKRLSEPSYEEEAGTLATRTTDLSSMVDSIDDQLATWLVGHPVFRTELSFARPPNVESHTLEDMFIAKSNRTPDIDSEWEAIALYGYMRGIWLAHSHIKGGWSRDSRDLDVDELSQLGAGGGDDE